MKLAILCNHSYPSIGGSEVVIQKIAEKLNSIFNYEVEIYSKSIKSSFIYNNIQYIRITEKYSDLSLMLNNRNIDKIFIYSDYFYHLPQILFRNDIKPTISIALVGANWLRTSELNKNIFLSKSSKIKILTHSENYEDSKFCKKNNLKYTVINNFVDKKEFESNLDFKVKYDIPQEREILLNVSNFYPGKGQEYIPDILSKVDMSNKVFISIAGTEPESYARTASLRLQKRLNEYNIPHILLKNIPRADTIAAFLNSKIFLFFSQKEVAPLVIIEAQASGLPWVALSVGNVEELKGGIISKSKGKNELGLMPDVADFTTSISKLLSDKDLYLSLKEKGLNQVNEEFLLDNVVKKYDEFFKEN